MNNFRSVPTVIDVARVRRDDGISRAEAHAELELPGWSGLAFRFVRDYALSHVDFMAEDVIAAAAARVPDPPDGRAWGAVFRAAARAGFIEKIGYGPAKTSNLSPKVRWGSRALDSTAQLEKHEWLKLARNYVRAFRHNIRREAFRTTEMDVYANRLGCPKPQSSDWWEEALRSEGLECIGTLQWYAKSCCDDCAKTGEHHQ